MNTNILTFYDNSLIPILYNWLDDFNHNLPFNLVEINQEKNEIVKMLPIHSHLILFANQTIMTKNQNIKCKQIQLHSIEWPANQIKCSANNVRSTLLFDRHTYSYHIYIYTYIYGYMQ